MIALLSLIATTLLSASAIAQDGRVIAGVPLVTNVKEHSEIDLDVRAIRDSLAVGDEATAKRIYELGANSQRSASENRTIKGFSKAMTDNTHKLFLNYYGTSLFADEFIQSAFARTGDFANKDLNIRAAAINTAINTLSIWSYVINEIDDGVVDCQAGSPTDNLGGALSVEEGWAFYTGSLEGQFVGGSANGVGLYRLAAGMCQLFGTCDTLRSGNVMARVNAEIAGNMSELIIASQQEIAPCNRSRQLVDNIVTTMRVPIVQSLLANVFQAATGVDTAARNRNKGAAWALRMTLAPYFVRCSPSSLELLEIMNPQTEAFPTLSQAREIGYAVEAAYFCLSISCADVGAATSLGHERCNDRSLLGYNFRSNVMDRAFIDLDVKRIADLLAGSTYDESRWTLAKDIYEEGQSSIRADGRIRTIMGIARDVSTYGAEPTFKVYRDFFKTDFYMDQFIQAAFAGTAPFRQTDLIATRREGVVKGIQYLTIWYKVISELEDGLGDCNQGTNVDNSNDRDFVGSIDEAWAFYTGSLHWSASRALANTTGVLMFNTNVKRCIEFNTCSSVTATEVRSVVNDKILSLMVSTQAAAETKNCATMAANIASIKSLMVVPLLQGMIKYLYLADPKVPSGASNRRKEVAEGFIFFKAVQPLIAQCDSSVASLIARNIDLQLDDAQMMKDGYVAVIRAVQSVYPCLKVSCSDVGSFKGISPAIACSDPVPDFSLNLAGYSLLTDVVDRARIDLDLRDMETFIVAENWVEARNRYLNGFNSARASGALRSFSALSRDFNKFQGESTWVTFRNYYNSSTYADDLIMRALTGADIFSRKSATVRKEVALKTALYQTIYNYVLHEVEDGIKTCKQGLLGDQSSDSDDALDIDEAWAFFVGSSHIMNPSNKGYLFYQANLKRCPEFKTCQGTSGTRARANDRVLGLLITAQAASTVRDCKTMEETLDKLRSQMLVPIIQGLLKYVYLTDKTDATKPLATSPTQLQKEWAEGFAFAAAALPLIDKCDANVAALVRENLALEAESPMTSGSDAVTKAIQSTFPCLGMTCAEVSAYAPSQGCKDASPSNSASNTLSGGAIAGIVIACVFVYLLSLFVAYKRGKKTGSDMANQNHGVETKGDEWKDPTKKKNPVTNGNSASNGSGSDSRPSQAQLEVV